MPKRIVFIDYIRVIACYLGYLVMAHYIREHLTWNCSRRMTVGALAFIVGGAFTAWSFWYTGVPGIEMKTPTLEWSWEFCTPNVLLATFGAFLMFTCIGQKTVSQGTEASGRGRGEAVITSIAKLSFGMYLMHILVLSNVAPLFMPDGPADPALPIYLTIPSMALLTFVISAAIAKLISYVPGSKWVIG